MGSEKAQGGPKTPLGVRWRLVHVSRIRERPLKARVQFLVFGILVTSPSDP